MGGGGGGSRGATPVFTDFQHCLRVNKRSGEAKAAFLLTAGDSPFTQCMSHFLAEVEKSERGRQLFKV